MLRKVGLYWNTIRYMKASQVYNRIKKTVKMEIKLKQPVIQNYDEVCSIATLQELDFDPDFLRRFPASEILEGKISFLHHTEAFFWGGEWKAEEQSALWNFNLHYFEYLHSLAKEYLNTGREAYLAESKKAILGWIQNNPAKEGGSGWAPYTISLRLTNWLSYWTNLQKELKQDAAFSQKLTASIYEQYVYLSRHLEKDLLGNHYFENLKALLLCAVFFQDRVYEAAVLKEFKKECGEQILKDGMHFELSPMYHKIILEDMLRAAWALRCAGRPDPEIEAYIKPMTDAAYTFENGLVRIPLFNDGGNNVSKSLSALIHAAEKNFEVKPEEKKILSESGYYFFNKGIWRLIVDAGQPGPAYIPGHAHCDAMSFELFKEGKPALVNCGTYAYQCRERGYFRSTEAHNTVMAGSTEQSQCWGAFRLAKRAKTEVLQADQNSVEMRMIDQKGHAVKRKIKWEDSCLCIDDCSRNNDLQAFLHIANKEIKAIGETRSYIEGVGTLEVLRGTLKIAEDEYSIDYGEKNTGKCLIFQGKGNIKIRLRLEEAE